MIWKATVVIAVLAGLQSASIPDVSRTELFAADGAIRIHVREVRVGEVRGYRPTAKHRKGSTKVVGNRSFGC